MLARSEMYVSLSRRTEEVVNYNTPVKLRVYGGFGHCDRRQLLAESGLITSYDWSEYQFKLEPTANYSYIILEAYYDTPVLFPYNGNILVDGASGLQPVSCSQPLPEPVQSEPVAVNEPPAEPEPNTSAQGNPRGAQQPAQPPVLPPAEPTPPAPQPERTAAPTSIAELNRDNVRKGITLRMDKLFFEADKATIRTGSEQALQELFVFLRDNPEVVIEIGGHTNGLPEPEYCDRLSTDRARSVANYLQRRGIPELQLEYKGYGKRFPIASDDTIEGRRQNQRVEIKILEVGNQGTN
jgi:outer membrane protein OmpA-like peptidoglycan-associated protein